VKYKVALPTILVFLAAATGFAEHFRNPVRLPTVSDPMTVVVADLNGDKRMDILWTTNGALINGPTTVQAFIAQPDGSFAAGPMATLPSGVLPYCQAVDETGDGIADLVCSAYQQPNVSVKVFPGNGDGTFGDAITTPLPQLDTVIGPPAMLNGDAAPDFVAGGAGTPGYVLLGKGDGTFQIVTQKNTTVSYQLKGQYQALDVNGDGHLDLVFSNGEVLLGDGTGQFTQAPNGGGVGVLEFCAFGKLDGDADVDEICGQESTINGDTTGGTQLLIYHGNGDGSFNRTPAKTINYGDRTSEASGYGTFRWPIAIVDLNGDGIPDLVADAADGMTVLLGKPGLNFSYPKHYATGYDPLNNSYFGQDVLRIADVDGDGLPDLVECGPHGVYFTYGRPDGVLDTAQAIELAGTVNSMTIADFNGDGIPDIAVTGDPAIELSLGKDDGTFDYRTSLPRGDVSFSSGNYGWIQHGDFNGDHRQDILALGTLPNGNGNVDLLLGLGNGTFASPIAATKISPAFPLSPAPQVFDFNGDGKDDLFNWADYSPTHFYVALSNGDGSFKMVTTSTTPNPGVLTQPAIADVNGDGKLDLVFGALSSVEIFYGRGAGAFASAPVKLANPTFKGAAVQAPFAVAVGDFDGDGHKDIALLATPTYNSQAPTDQKVLFVFFGNGAGAFTPGMTAGVFDRQYSALFAADVNKDGKDDIVLESTGGIDIDSGLAIVHSLPARQFGPEEDYYPGSGAVSFAIADLNRDGFPDLLFVNQDVNTLANSATVLMNLGNATGVTGLVYALTEPSNAGGSFRVVASLDAPNQTALSGSVSFFVDGQAAGSAALVGNQAGITVKAALAAGLHTLRAMWPGDGNFAAVTLSGRHQVTNGYPTSTALTCNFTESVFLTAITLRATVESSSGTPGGSVMILDGKTRLGTMRLSGGSASFAISTLVPGTHNVTAQFVPDPGWAASSTMLAHKVDPANVTATLAVNSKKVYALQPIVLTATVKAPAGGPAPTGTVQFSDDFGPLGTSKLVNGIAAFTTSIGTPGYSSVSAEYSGNQDYNQGYAEGPAINVLANPTAVRVTATPNPATAGEGVKITVSVTSSTVTHPAPTGTVQVFDNGGSLGTFPLVNGSASVTLSTLAVASHPISATYSGAAAFSMSQSKPLALVIWPGASTTALTVTPNPAKVNATVILTAVVKGPRPPTGTVNFYDGATKLSAAIALDFEGTATFSTSKLAAGTHSVVAKYSGDPNLNTSASKAVSLTVNP